MDITVLYLLVCFLSCFGRFDQYYSYKKGVFVMIQSVRKNNYKLGSVLLVALTSSGVVYSGVMGEASQDNKGWFFGASAVYGKFGDDSMSRTDYANTLNLTNAGDIIQLSTKLPNTRAGWGYQLNLGYRLDPADTRDIILSYLDFSNSGRANASALNPLGGNNYFNKLTLIGTSTSQNSLYDGQGSVYLKYNYQTASLLTYNHAPVELVPYIQNLQFTNFYGIKASAIKRKLIAETSGFSDSSLTSSLFDYINSKGSMYGIGPEIGMGTKWSLTNYIDLNGDVFAAALFGNFRSKWNESLNSSSPVFIYGVGTGQSFVYSQRHKSMLWGALNLGGDLSISTHYYTKNNGKFQVDLGVNGEQYVSDPSVDKFDSQFSGQSTSFTNLFSFTNAFLRINYFC